MNTRCTRDHGRGDHFRAHFVLVDAGGVVAAQEPDFAVHS